MNRKSLVAEVVNGDSGQRKRHRRRLGAGLTVLVVSALLVFTRVHSLGSGNGSQTDSRGLPTTPTTAEYLASRPDAHLVYPGATVLRTNVHAEGPTIQSIDGSSVDAAFVEVFMATPESATAVRDWYKAQLNARDYMCIAGAGADYMSEFDTYLRGSREILVVGYIIPEQLRITFGQRVPSNRTIFETDYILSSVSAGLTHAVVPANCYRPLPSPTPPAAP